MIFRSGKKGYLIPKCFRTIFICLPIGVMVFWFLRWFFFPRNERNAAVEIVTPRSEGIRLPIKEDDFRKLKGIGPKTAAVLYKAKLFTYEQLGLIEPEKLAEILKKAGLPAGSVEFWQKQAVLAASEDWKGLEKLQK